jgi:hypothetical protein
MIHLEFKLEDVRLIKGEGIHRAITLEVASQAAIATDPGERPLANLLFGQDLEAGNIGSLHVSSFRAPVCQTTSAIFSPA